jgi:diaminopimelate epimerase
VLTRSHGLGNDYLVADPSELPFSVTPARVRLLCDRHFGVGSDGLLLLDGALGVRIFNPDGSETEKSGNGLRIFGRWLYTTGRAPSPQFTVRTRGGSAAIEIGEGHDVTVDMGKPTFLTEPTELEVDGQRVTVTPVSMGNPHCVIFRDQLDVTELRRLGPLVERHPAFPHRTNVQLVHPLDRASLELLIWERGAGETQASGSSSCAAVAAAHRAGLVDDRDVTARMPGGELFIRIDLAGNLWLRGPVEEVATIHLSGDLVRRLQALP